MSQFDEAANRRLARCAARLRLIARFPSPCRASSSASHLLEGFPGFLRWWLRRAHHRSSGGSGPWLVAQTVQAVLYKAPTALADRHLDHTELRRHLLVLGAFRTGQHDPSPQRQGLSRLATARQCLQLCSLLIA